MAQCVKCGLKFEITNEDLAFYKKVSPKINGEIFEIPKPTHCPKCRTKRRMTWRNDRHLHENVCAITGKKLITTFASDGPVKPVDREYWYTDNWDATKYGQEIDFERPFFEQFNELLQKVPLPHSMKIDCQNCEYANYTYKSKNCYLCFAGNYLEDSFYCYNTQSCQDCSDCLFLWDSELCYEAIHSNKCYNCKFVLHCTNCADSAFIEDCIGCRNCFMCFNLSNAEYCYKNKKYSRQEYQEIISKYDFKDPQTIEKLIQEYQEERKKHQLKNHHNTGSENCTGEYILNSKNCQNCYIMAKNCEDCRYILNGFPSFKDAMDCTYSGENAELFYETMATGGDGSRVIFGNLCCGNAHDLIYCNVAFHSRNCFGCTSIRNNEYCILNKQYSKEEYEKNVAKLINHMKETGEWGEFFPSEISPIPYHESLAQEYFPEPLPHKESPHKNHPQAQECQTCKQQFLHTSAELKYYEKISIAPPKNCFNCRHTNRLKLCTPPNF